MAPAEGQSDRQKSILWPQHPQFVLYFTIDRQDALWPRANPLDENRYEVHLYRLKGETDPRCTIPASIGCRSSFRIVFTDTK